VGIGCSGWLVIAVFLASTTEPAPEYGHDISFLQREFLAQFRGYLVGEFLRSAQLSPSVASRGVDLCAPIRTHRRLPISEESCLRARRRILLPLPLDPVLSLDPRLKLKSDDLYRRAVRLLARSLARCADKNAKV
jgi:hypothetical protein